ncbi:hypothetical protein [Thermomonospora cellulosilytica]|uniref:Uncharacterized protein n=1 Tax=Thermomonospora cellulosilytica TaxID=1411118 RepID=A0A7W3RAP8_9ACTN|nr:hypothetical protein [Thermomonospora cellulosilytica]MBA9005924.1 hypothetical protein [Thermomonospora cellulosilytica]
MLSRRGGPEHNPLDIAGAAAPPNPADMVLVRVAWLRALIAVFGPWTASHAVGATWRRWAAELVAAAHRELAEHTGRRTDGTWKPAIDEKEPW